ncbi:MAG: RDD family protein [Chloroflexi bacterium]|nr:RDD family protein [Chloroflexota bacterium]MYD17642.1 RDD family protein [Chloroflexota bacterium]
MTSRKPDALRAEHCLICDEYPGVGVFCAKCGVLMSHPTSGDYAAPYLRRLGCEILDLLIFLLLPIWLYMMWFTSRDGQSPAKSLLDLYVVSEAGQEVTPQRMWMRELVIKRLLLGFIGYAFGLLGPIINAGWILMNPDRQCVHDRMVGTLVVVRREAPQFAARSSELASAEVRLPPPAPAGPRVTQPTRRPAASAAVSKEQSSRPRPELAPRSPELDALERERGSLSQTEYERRRRALLREARDAREAAQD